MARLPELEFMGFGLSDKPNKYEDVEELRKKNINFLADLIHEMATRSKNKGEKRNE